MTTWIFTALDGRTWRAQGETADEAYRAHLSGDLNVPSWSMLDIEEADEDEPEPAPAEPPPPCEPSKEDAVVDEFDRAVREAGRLSAAHRDATLVALDAATAVYAYSLEAMREMVLERASLLEENARLRNEIRQWRSEAETNLIAVGYDADEEVEEP